jgi:chemotaxis response regulator CheB
MPAAAQALGAAERMVPLENIPAALIDWASKKPE